MPVPVINFAALQPQGNPGAKSILPSILQGLQAGYAPFQMNEELKKQQLANALAEIQKQYAPQMNEAEVAYKQAQIPHLNAQTGLLNEQVKYYGPNAEVDLDYKRNQIPLLQAQAEREKFGVNNPLLDKSGTAGQIGALMYLQQHPELLQNPAGEGAPPPNTTLPKREDLSQLLFDSIKSEIERKSSFADFYGKRAEGYEYSTLPMAQKNKLIAQAGGMGIDPIISTNAFIQGKTIAQLAEERGLDPNNLPDPIYPATQADITRIHFRQQALAEINTLEPKLMEALAPYSNRFKGYSPKQIGEALTGSNPQGQAKYLAAQALMPELAALRLKAMGGQIGIEALREVIDASMGNIKSYQPFVSEEVYRASQEYISQWLNEAVSKANSVGLQSGSNQKNNSSLTINEEQQQSLQNSGIGKPGDLVPVKSPDGQFFNVPTDKVDALLKKNPQFQRIR